MKWSPALLLPLLLIAGCDRREIETYQTPKTAEPTLAVATAPEADHELTWTLPKDWRLVPQTSAMRIATFEVGEGDAKLTITITSFPGDVGGLLANINRWRGQVQLPAVESLEQQPMQSFDLAGRAVHVVSLPGMTAAMIEEPDRCWFVKMTGPAEAVTAQQEPFTQFVGSLKWKTMQ
ncbi:MAG: hypothetical protein IT445_20220 [Phycisphaeraceae bacterium]|nr:hypothetical protein [Phycisphaeraceae bacterium]